MWNIFNLVKPKNIESGLAEVLYIAPLTWFEKVMQPQPPYFQKGDEVTVLNDHVFKEGFGFLKLQLMPDKNKYTLSPKGEKGGLSFTHQLECVVPGSYEALHSFMFGLTNIPIVAMIKDANCGDSWCYMLGGNDIGAYLIPEFTTGKTNDGVKGYSAKILFTLNQAQLYFADIQVFKNIYSTYKPIFSLNSSKYDGKLEDINASKEAFIQNGITNSSYLFQWLQQQATNSIVTITLVNDNGISETTTFTDFSLTTLSALIAYLETWLSVNGNGQIIVNDNGKYKLKDNTTQESYLSVIAPQNLLGGGGGVLELGGALIII